MAGSWHWNLEATKSWYRHELSRGAVMRISSVHIENFRSFEAAMLPLNNYTCLVGPNGAGKSTVLTALNVFFRESENPPTDLSQLDQEDFHRKHIDKPIQITVTFTDLDAEARKDFSHYVRQDQLVVSAVATFDGATGKAQVTQYGQRLGMRAFAPFFEAANVGERVSELKDIYAGLRGTYPGLPAPGTKEAMIGALHDFEAARPGQCNSAGL